MQRLTQGGPRLRIRAIARGVHPVFQHSHAPCRRTNLAEVVLPELLGYGKQFMSQRVSEHSEVALAPGQGSDGIQIPAVLAVDYSRNGSSPGGKDSFDRSPIAGMNQMRAVLPDNAKHRTDSQTCPTALMTDIEHRGCGFRSLMGAGQDRK